MTHLPFIMAAYALGVFIPTTFAVAHSYDADGEATPAWTTVAADDGKRRRLWIGWLPGLGAVRRPR